MGYHRPLCEPRADGTLIGCRDFGHNLTQSDGWKSHYFLRNLNHVRISGPRAELLDTPAPQVKIGRSQGQLFKKRWLAKVAEN